MKRLNTIFLLTAILFSLPVFAGELTTFKQQYSYTVGVQIGKMLRAQQTGEMEMEIFLQGVEDTLENKPMRLDAIHMRDAMKKHYANMQAQRENAAKENSARGTAFREQNGQRENVVTLKSGLQYEVMQAGDGTPPQNGDTVEVHYHGSLIDGSVFDSSRQRGKAAKFSLDKVVPGFREALLLMKPGAKWKVVMPPELAYGKQGAGKKIGPNETLIFELELLKVEAKPKSVNSGKP